MDGPRLRTLLMLYAFFTRRYGNALERQPTWCWCVEQNPWGSGSGKPWAGDVVQERDLCQKNGGKTLGQWWCSPLPCLLRAPASSATRAPSPTVTRRYLRHLRSTPGMSEGQRLQDPPCVSMTPCLLLAGSCEQPQRSSGTFHEDIWAKHCILTNLECESL